MNSTVFNFETHSRVTAEVILVSLIIHEVQLRELNF